MDKKPMLKNINTQDLLKNINTQDLLKNINTQDLLKNIQPNPLPNIHINRHKEMDDAMAQFHRQKAEDRQVQKNIEANTKKIAENTEWLSQSVNLIRINNEKQTELLELITQVLALANETDKVEAESKLRVILNSVQGFKENFELATFLKDFGEQIIQLITNG